MGQPVADAPCDSSASRWPKSVIKADRDRRNIEGKRSNIQMGNCDTKLLLQK